MPKSLVQESIPGQLAGTGAPCEQIDQSTLANGWLRRFGTWIERSRQRRAIEELARLNNHYLEDIGVSKDEALREAAKPFWRR